jgi:glutaminyl-tRNA synthetase
MDDTNPAKEDVEYVDSIIEDVRWLISGWADERLGLKARGNCPLNNRSMDDQITLFPGAAAQNGGRCSAGTILCFGLFRSALCLRAEAN